MAIIDLQAAKKQLNIDPDYTSDDDELQLYMDAVTVPLEKELGHVVELRTFTDLVTVAAGTRSLLLSRVPVADLVSLGRADGSATWPVDDSALSVDPDSGLLTVVSGPALSGHLAVVYQAGTADIQPNWKLAGLIILQHLWETQRGAMGVQLGGEGEAWTPGRGFAIPRRAVELLETNLPGVA